MHIILLWLYLSLSLSHSTILFATKYLALLQPTHATAYHCISFSVSSSVISPHFVTLLLQLKFPSLSLIKSTCLNLFLCSFKYLYTSSFFIALYLNFLRTCSMSLSLSTYISVLCNLYLQIIFLYSLIRSLCVKPLFHFLSLKPSDTPRRWASVTRWLYCFFNICPFVSIKMGLKNWLKNLQRRFNILPNIKQTRKQLTKTFKMLPIIGRNFAKSGHTAAPAVTQCQKAREMISKKLTQNRAASKEDTGAERERNRNGQVTKSVKM